MIIAEITQEVSVPMDLKLVQCICWDLRVGMRSKQNIECYLAIILWNISFCSFRYLLIGFLLQILTWRRNTTTVRNPRRTRGQSKQSKKLRFSWKTYVTSPWTEVCVEKSLMFRTSLSLPPFSSFILEPTQRTTVGWPGGVFCAHVLCPSFCPHNNQCSIYVCQLGKSN